MPVSIGPQNVIGRSGMKMKIRDRKGKQKSFYGKRPFEITNFESDLAILQPIYLHRI
jgi:hypothetical protein